MAALTPAEIQAVLNGPLGPPPPGQQPFSPNPPSLVREAQIVVSVLFAISTLAIAVRLCTHALMDKRWFLEDYFGLAYWGFLLGEFVPTFFLLDHGIGMHAWDITLGSFLQAQYYSNINTIFYALAILAVKVAIILQFLRIFVPTRTLNRSLFWGCWIWIGIITVFYVIDFFASVFQCNPRAKISNPFLGGKCLNTESLFQATGLFNIFSDVAILLLPVPSIWTLHCSWQRKLQIYAVFAVGILACVASILRTYYTWRLFTSTDQSWDITFTGYWTWVEACVGALVFCLPTFPRPFALAKIKAHTTWASIASRTRGSGGSGSGTRTRGSGSSRLPSMQDDRNQSVPNLPSENSKKEKKPYMPHMVVSLASWEDPEEYRDLETGGNSFDSRAKRPAHDIPMKPLSPAARPEHNEV